MYCRFLSVAGAVLVAGLLTACSPSADFHTNQGEQYHWQDLEGDYVIVNYFAEWCAPCLRELPELNHFYQQHGHRAKLFGVSFDGLSNEQLAQLRDDHGIEFPLILNQPPAQLPFASPTMLPATYVVTPAGEVKGPLLGEQTEQSLLKAIGVH
ncbi:Thiol-disulfide oxidoreductase ResA [Pseudidiomarina piscicola]|uniref:Thiol-disulfide oxidoreductase ResA n=1 Tax=Pseudidiomarina piscicola TaxID=2614830 RepID=A0A6S6WK17_9GAMM|nr:TlpA disulfide reductase family protein [Pseudidiomarina piscicola]CAB0150200.1 Thiol-disulfide oxidoreductase ResA [Pseudidiomarina piscicola]VZT39638.1 Thiol-disulfide oxidoreductase ResA [Pseudomonas aeruginosa]